MEIAQSLIILSMIGTSLGQAIVLYSAFNAIGRNPELEKTLFTKVLIGAALVETTAIYALVAFFSI